MRDPKFTFVSEEEIGNIRTLSNGGVGVAYRVNLNRNNNKNKVTGKTWPQYILYFPREVIEVYDLIGKGLEFFVDREKKAIGWRVEDVNEFTSPEKLSKLRIVKYTSGTTTGTPSQWTTSVSRLINFGKIDIPHSISQIQVQKYVKTDFGKTTDIFYIDLRKTEDTTIKTEEEHQEEEDDAMVASGETISLPKTTIHPAMKHMDNRYKRKEEKETMA